MDRAAQCEGAARIQRHEVAGREDADDAAVGIHDRQVVDAGGHHLDGGLGRKCVGAHRLDRLRHDGLHRRLGERPWARTLSRRSRSVTMPRPSRGAHEQGRALLSLHQLGRLPRGRVGVAEQRCTADQRRDRTSDHIGQGTHRSGGVEETLAQAARHEPHACRPAQDVQRHLFGDDVERRILSGLRGEFRRQASQQRRVAEHLAAHEDADHGPLVGKLEGPFLDHIELGPGHTALYKDRLARRHSALDDRRGHPLELVPAESLEWFATGQEAGPLSQLIRVVRRQNSAHVSPSASTSPCRRHARRAGSNIATYS